MFGDGAYNGHSFRGAVEKHGAETVVPPPRDAIVHADAIDPALRKRNDSVREIHGLGGDDVARELWKKLKGYHCRSLAETTMYRIKQLTGGNVRSRRWESQCVEANIKCLVINMMTRLGMPIGRWEEAA